MKTFQKLFSKNAPENQGFQELDLAPVNMDNFVHTKNVDNLEQGTTLTVFFNGTSSHIDKDTDPSLNYPEGELVSNLYKNCTGPSIQVDGVGTGNEDSMYNIATGNGVTNRVKIVHDFIREHPEITDVNIVGWSRGGVESIMLANALDGQRNYEDLGVGVNLMVFDPVPGTDQLDKDMDMKARLGENVKTYKAFYARDEVSNSFSPIVPEIDPEIENPETVIDMKVVPGRHATLVGNYSVRGDQLKPKDLMSFGNIKNKQKLTELNEMVEDGFDQDVVDNVHETGKLVRDEVEKQLEQWGTPLESKLGLSNERIHDLKELQEQNNNVYENMHNHTYPTPQEKVSGKGKGSNNGDRLMHTVHAFSSMSKQLISDFEINLDDYNITPQQVEQNKKLNDKENDKENEKGNESVDLEQSQGKEKSFDNILKDFNSNIQLDFKEVNSNKSQKQNTPVIDNGDKKELGV